MIRWLIRWVARHDIDAAYLGGLAQGQADSEERERISYARGQIEGQIVAFETVKEEIRDRGGAEIIPLDLARVRRRLLH